MPTIRMKKKPTSEQAASDFWMITFGDLLMLLLTFFVMLLTMKSMNQKDLREFFPNASLKGGPLEFSDTGFTGNAPDFYGDNEQAVFVEDPEAMKQIFEIMKDIPTSLPDQEEVVKRLQEAVRIEKDPKGVVVTFQADRLFMPGTATINPSAMPALGAVGMLLRMTTNPIIVMGHAGAAELRTTQIKTKWALSLYQALEVLYYLTDSVGMPHSRIAVGGYGAKKPGMPEGADGERTPKDRIEFILMNNR